MIPTTVSSSATPEKYSPQILNNTKKDSVPSKSNNGFDTKLQPILSNPNRYETNMCRQVDPALSDNEISVDIKQDENKADKRNGRGKAFSQEETLFLAKAWIEQSAKGCNQRDRTMWNGVEDICKRKYKMDRSSLSLKSTWHRVSRETQHFLAARKKVRSMKISGANDDLLEDIVQEQYRKRAGRKAKDGSIVYAAPYKWVSTADYLSNHDKFSDEGNRKITKSISSKESTKTRTEAVNGKGTDENLHASREADNNICAPVEMKKDQEDGAISSDEEIRPKGIKRRKVEEKHAKEESRVADTLRGIQRSLMEGNQILRQEKERSEIERHEVEDVELLKLLDRSSPEFKEIMDDVMRRRRERVKKHMKEVPNRTARTLDAKDEEHVQENIE